jgi:hypothetical protein
VRVVDGRDEHELDGGVAEDGIEGVHDLDVGEGIAGGRLSLGSGALKDGGEVEVLGKGLDERDVEDCESIARRSARRGKRGGRGGGKWWRKQSRMVRWSRCSTGENELLKGEGEVGIRDRDEATSSPVADMPKPRTATLMGADMMRSRYELEMSGKNDE